jgi:hypothetical protein
MLGIKTGARLQQGAFAFEAASFAADGTHIAKMTETSCFGNGKDCSLDLKSHQKVSNLTWQFVVSVSVETI